MKCTKKSVAVFMAILILLISVMASPIVSSAVDTTKKYMVVGETDTSASQMYDNYSKMINITAESTNTSVATIVIDPKAAHSVTVTAVAVGHALINVYAGGNLAMVYDITVTDKKVEGVLSGKFVLVHDKGDIGQFESDGTLSFNPTAVDYVWVRNYDTGVQYCTDGWQGNVDTVTLVNQKDVTKNFDKLLVPAGQHTMRLIDNGNDTFTLTYADVTAPTTPQETEPDTTPVDDGKTHLLVLGDSIAYGYGLSSLDLGYPRMIAKAKDYSLKNDAVNGHATYDLLPLLESNAKVIGDASDADIVSISIGGNDLLQNMNDLITNINAHSPQCEYVVNLLTNFETNLNKIVARIKALKPESIIILQTLYNPAAIKTVPGRDFSAYAEQIYPVLNTTYGRVASRFQKVYVADVYTAMAAEFAKTKDKDLIQDDGIHPSPSGNVVIYNTLMDMIDKIEKGEADKPQETTAPTTQTATTVTEPATTEPTTAVTEPTTPPPVKEKLYGDANTDGKVNIKDATEIQKHLLMLSRLDENQLALADVDGNNEVNINDVSLIQKYSADLITKFPCESK